VGGSQRSRQAAAPRGTARGEAAGLRRSAFPGTAWFLAGGRGAADPLSASRSGSARKPEARREEDSGGRAPPGL